MSRGNRGKWLEAAVKISAGMYGRMGHACIQQVPVPSGMTRRGEFFRAQSTVDFVGVYRGKAVAFDCKVTKQASLPHSNVHQHQLGFLEGFSVAGGIGGLLIAFEAGAGSYFCTAQWYADTKAKLDRKSIPETRFKEGAERDDEDCFAVPHGNFGFPVYFSAALDLL